MIEIKNRWTGEVMHTVEAETVKEAVVKLVENGSKLRGSDLSYSNLSDSDLSDSDLRGSDLRCSDLSGSDLRGSDLSDAIKVPMYCKWSHGITYGNLIHIGCEKRTIEEWDVFFNSNEKIETERGTHEFKQIQAVYSAYKAYLQTINQ